MEPPSKHRIHVLNESGRRVPVATIRRAVLHALVQEQVAPSEVCVLVTGDEPIRKLNREFRGIDEPTDVLTFPSGEAASGDVAISLPYAERQASLRRVPLRQELGFLAIHGGLHLAGINDESETERAHMVQRMNQAAASAGLKPDLEWWSVLHGATA